MCATPSATFFLTFLRTRDAAALFGAFAIMISLNPDAAVDYFFSDCAALRGPLRVRAFGAGTQAANRQALAMTQAAVAAKVHQTLDAHRDFAAKVAFDNKLADFVTQLFQLVVVQVLDLLVGRYTRLLADFLCARTADAIDRGQADHGVLMVGDVDPCNTCHSLFLDQ